MERNVWGVLLERLFLDENVESIEAISFDEIRVFLTNGNIDVIVDAFESPEEYNTSVYNDLPKYLKYTKTEDMIGIRSFTERAIPIVIKNQEFLARIHVLFTPNVESNFVSLQKNVLTVPNDIQ